jgi:hypothetical protein
MPGKYIFVAGAPGSRWSAVCRSLYRSGDCDCSDASPQREYRMRSEEPPMHVGAYWDPGMEFGRWFDRLDRHDPAECEGAFDAPFSGSGVRVVKAHTFCHHVAYLRRHWPDCHVVLVHRPDATCLDWWLAAGGFAISYPDYRPYYRDIATMAKRIAQQNGDMLRYAASEGVPFDIPDSSGLCRRLGLPESTPAVEFAALDTAVAAVGG